MNTILAAGFESVFRFIVTLILFIVVLAVCYLTTVWIGNFQKGKFGRGNIEVVEVYKISGNKYIEIVRIGNKYYALAVSKDRVEKIDVLEENEIELPDGTFANVNETFAQVLEKFKNLGHKQDKE